MITHGTEKIITQEGQEHLWFFKGCLSAAIIMGIVACLVGFILALAR